MEKNTTVEFKNNNHFVVNLCVIYKMILVINSDFQKLNYTHAHKFFFKYALVNRDTLYSISLMVFQPLFSFKYF